MSLLTASVFLLLLIALSAFVSSAEIAIAAARKVKLQILAKEGDVRALVVLNMQEHPGSFITVVQVVLNAVAISAGAIGESAISPYLELLFNNEALASVVSFVLVTSVFSLFADLMPRRLAMSNTELIAVKLVQPMIFLIFILKPIIWVFDGAANLIFKLIGISTVRNDDMTSEDIYAVMDAGAEAGVLKQQEHHLIENIFEMQERTVTSVMNPREHIVYFDSQASTEQVVKVMIEQPHNKFLVCHDDDLEHITGYVESRSFLALVLEQQEVCLTDKALLKPALFIPNTLSLFEVLEMFKSTGADFAVIVNEYGLVVGVITLKDVMSIVMGELVTLEEQPIVQRTDNSWLIDGMTPIEDVIRSLGIINLPNSQNYETISGFMTYMLRKIPKKTDSIEYANYRFEILATDNHKINQLLVTKFEDII
ncbi:CBS domain containing-hemolysin-like protein [Psychrobacter sp. PL15]|uniref:hemolysin family protein n=1 Tax=unclassified Psychrobacter TaxID=196806 RepID=UPI001AE25D75|nr:hemolysin family protein [Psychrobacter sp. PL15]MEC5209995.1 CBS domain containing-hemolysin-like protein [Psychrobacter sp. PL15]